MVPTEGRTDDGVTPALRRWLVFDAWNRLVAVYDDDGSITGTFETGSDTQLAAYEYDGLHRRVVKIDKTGESDVEYDYYYNTAAATGLSVTWPPRPTPPAAGPLRAPLRSALRGPPAERKTRQWFSHSNWTREPGHSTGNR